MSTVPVHHDVRQQWLNGITIQLNRVDIRLRNDAYPVELTTAGADAYRFLVQATQTLERGHMILEDAVRRAIQVFTTERRQAFVTTFMRRPLGPAREIWQGEVNTTYLIWEDRIVDADGDPADVTVTQQWLTYENGGVFSNTFVVDRDGVAVHIPPYVYCGHTRRSVIPSE